MPDEPRVPGAPESEVAPDVASGEATPEPREDEPIPRALSEPEPDVNAYQEDPYHGAPYESPFGEDAAEEHVENDGSAHPGQA